LYFNYTNTAEVTNKLCTFLWSVLYFAYTKFVISTERNRYVRSRTF